MPVSTPQTIFSTVSPAWVITGNPASGGNATLAVSTGTAGDAILYLNSFTNVVPLDYTIEGISVAFRTDTSGTFGATDILKVNLGTYTSTGVLLQDGIEKSLVLTGLNGSTSTLGGAVDSWGRSFFSRQELTYANGTAFALSFRRTGSSQLQISQVVVTIYCTQRSTLCGSRAPVPGSLIAKNISTIIPEKFDGVTDTSLVKSSDVNLLGDGLYNIQKYSINVPDLSNDIKVYGADTLFLAMTLTGKVSNVIEDLSFEEVQIGSTHSAFTTGLSNVVRNKITLPSGSQSEFEFVKAISWVESGTSKIALNTDVHSLNFKGSDFRIAITSSTPRMLKYPESMQLGDYGGLFYEQLSPVSELSRYTELHLNTHGVPGSANISDMSLTYPDGPVILNPPNPQPFVIEPVTGVGNNSSGFTISLSALAMRSIDPTLATVTKGVKYIENLAHYDYVEFQVPHISKMTDYPTQNKYSLFRGGLFIFGQGDPTSSLSGYAVMFSKGPQNGVQGVMWLVKLSNFNTASTFNYTGFSTSSPTAYQTFPVTDASITNIGSTYYTFNGAISEANPKKYRLKASHATGTTTVTLDAYDPTTNTYATVLTAADSSSPITTPGLSGLFQLKSNQPVTFTQTLDSKVYLNNLYYGFNTINQETLNYYCKLIAFGRLKYV